jgi:AcrR family transcriptional regulator
VNVGVRQARSENTRQSLMRAAEKLFAEQGVENVTVRAIIEQSGQKNESALQYHFKNRQGLIDAIHHHRNAQAHAKRSELLGTLLKRNSSPSLREICRLMVEPAFFLARTDSGFRQWVKAFGRGVATSSVPAFQYIQGHARAKQEQSILEMEKLLRGALNHLDDRLFRHRVDSTVRFVGLSMSQQAREKYAFRGVRSDVFFNMLIDAMTGILAAEVSEHTRNAIVVADNLTSDSTNRETS